MCGQTNRQQHGGHAEGLSVPSTRVRQYSVGLKRENQGPHGKSRSLLLDLSEDGRGLATLPG